MYLWQNHSTCMPLDLKTWERACNMKFVSIMMLLALVATIAGCAEEDTLPGGSGFLEANESVVSAEASGRVVSMSFNEGTQVSAGDTLLVIDTTTLQLQLEAATAGLTAMRQELETARVRVKQARESEHYAERERDRIGRLYKSGTATERTFDEVEHQYQQAVLATEAAVVSVKMLQARIEKTQADMALVEKQLADCYPAAPFPGRVTEEFAEVGELLTPGRPIAKVSRLDTLWVKIYMDAGDFASVRLGDAATVDTESGGKTYTGTVVWASDEAEFTPKNVQTKDARANLVYAVKVEVANSDNRLKIGMPVYVTVETE
ncbi:HlyD family efflux transporter periplasmic adaptor subunit [candidate division GN15 bacterium]|nr:HlyD family efflux transporter periplasmic adaptor subunit [candidate division GN15 bacterium]